jgi:hypothetical protein
MASIAQSSRPGGDAELVRFVGMGGSSIAAPSAAGWVTDFLNAAYFARTDGQRSVDDLRIAFAILTTHWHRLGRRLALGDLAAYHRAFGRYRMRRLRRGGPTLSREALHEGAGRLLGDGFAAGFDEACLRGWGIVFRSKAERDAYVPEDRLKHAALRPLTPPLREPLEQRWHTYPAVELPSAASAVSLMSDPSRWPEFGSALGRFTAVRTGGLAGQTFEIEVVASPIPRTPVLTRGYVTVTALLEADSSDNSLAAYVDRLTAQMAAVRAPGGDRPMPPEASPYALVELTTHQGHFIGRAISRLLVFEHAGSAFIRDIGSWDPMPLHLAIPHRLAGYAAQVSFWGSGDPDRSMLHQLALRATVV